MAGDLPTRCPARYERPGGREPGDRIVACHLQAGHPGEHEEADTEVTWENDEPSGDLPEGQQPVNVASSWCSDADGCHWASHMRGGAPLYVKICTLCKRIDWDDLADQVARVRADVAGAITADLQEARRAAAAPASMESLDRALRIVARHAVAPAESVVGAATPTPSCAALLAAGQAIWGVQEATVSQVAVRAAVVAGDLARVARAVDEGGEPDMAEVGKELGNLILSGVRWAVELRLDPDECVRSAIEAQRAYAGKRFRGAPGALPEDEGTRQEGLINVEE